MELILWRHAEAEEGEPDAVRALTAKGRRQAKRVAKWLARRLPEGTRVIASPARRARQTARALAREVETLPEAAVGADPKKLLRAVGWPQGEARAVVVVGHQPTLGEAAALALAGTRASIALKKGAFVWLAWRRRAGRGEVTLRAAASPGLL
jgi:phosphohistidine phosphatase